MFCKTLFIVRANVPPCWLAKIACCAPSTSALPICSGRVCASVPAFCGIFPVYGLCIVVALPALTGAVLASTGACWMFGRIAACVPACICGRTGVFTAPKPPPRIAPAPKFWSARPRSNTPFSPAHALSGLYVPFSTIDCARSCRTSSEPSSSAVFSAFRSLDALPCGTSMPPMVSIPAVAAEDRMAENAASASDAPAAFALS